MLLAGEGNEKMLIVRSTVFQALEEKSGEMAGFKLPFRSCQELGMCLLRPHRHRFAA
jgi:hypothetical protein